ncbi:HamA C-terminal domain-containing protein [Ferrimonas balearica]|uniref:HamA C-terminal domain-containing protein n=1 Tax=Ferrimonas balearica TaxID=44012 RepID=UPI001C575218|nr:DUF1837 domain-containing protein [Ferrimonas balearica]MBW3165160.1 DUF1837 domain-containing protein [Ferrimonas balearica]
MTTAPFDSRSVIEEKISKVDLRAYLVGFDLDDTGASNYRWSPLLNKIMQVVHEFSYGMHEGNATKNTETYIRLIDAAKSIYKVDHYQKVRQIIENGDYVGDDIEDKYLRRGEFGELILHLLLRDNFGTIPLLSKIYFKDSLGHTVHGFDSVHIQPETDSIWLGESKLYIDPKRGVAELIKDIDAHLKIDYLNEEFTLIAKKTRHLDNGNINNDVNFKSDRHSKSAKEWTSWLMNSEKLKDKLKSVYIPLLCTYSCDIFSKYDDESDYNFIQEYQEQIEELKKFFDERLSNPLVAKVKIVLILFPVQCKIELVRGLHKKLTLLQALGE